MDITSPAFWVAVVQIIAIDIVLGGDNAVVIALASRRLPEAQRKLAIFWGVFGAIALLPWVFPLALAMITPGAAVAIKAWLGRTMERHGHWIAALICGAFGVHMWMNAVAAWPG
jgi:predicted tellurium resistance membrane protein TerC